MAVMDGSEANNKNNHHHHHHQNHSNGNTNTNHLGVSRTSSKIGKSMSKRNVIQPPKQQPPVYNIDKNDFRNTVQRLTGSPASSEPPNPPPPANNKLQTSARLQKIRPPPLSFNGIGPVHPVPSQASPPPPAQRISSNANAAVPASTSTSTSASAGATPPMMMANPFASCSPTFFSPLPPLTPSDEVWANPSESPITSVSVRNLAKSLMNSMATDTNNLQQQQDYFATAASIATNAWIDQTAYGANKTSQWNPSPQKSVPRPNSLAQFPIPSPGSQFSLPSPLPSPGLQFALPSPLGSQFQSPGLQFPSSPGAFFPLSPLSHLAGFQSLAAPSLPPSPGSTLLCPSPTGRFPLAVSLNAPSPRGFGVPNSASLNAWLTDSPTAGLTAHFSVPDHGRHM